jgi:hypothetical protein
VKQLSWHLLGQRDKTLMPSTTALTMPTVRSATNIPAPLVGRYAKALSHVTCVDCAASWKSRWINLGIRSRRHTQSDSVTFSTDSAWRWKNEMCRKLVGGNWAALSGRTIDSVRRPQKAATDALRALQVVV